MNNLLLSAKETFDSIKHYGNYGQEYWYARELFPLLGYSSWQKFENSINKAMGMCTASGIDIRYHFAESRKIVQLGSGSQREIQDYILSRYACYSIAINGNTQECAFAQAYFITTTMMVEQEEAAIEENYNKIHQLRVREAARNTDKRFSAAMLNNGVSKVGVARVKSAGDEAFFGGYNTREMKSNLGVANNIPLSDVLDPMISTARALAEEFTTKDINGGLYGEDSIKDDHINNNEYMRSVLTNRGYYPEEFPAVENTRKTQRYIDNTETGLENGARLVLCPISFI